MIRREFGRELEPFEHEDSAAALSERPSGGAFEPAHPERQIGGCRIGGYRCGRNNSPGRGSSARSWPTSKAATSRARAKSNGFR